MTPLERELSGPPRSVSDMADILERHIGDGTDQQRCAEVIDTLKGLRRHSPSYSVRVTLKLLDIRRRRVSECARSSTRCATGAISQARDRGGSTVPRLSSGAAEVQSIEALPMHCSSRSRARRFV